MSATDGHPRFERDEQEPAPIFECDGKQPMILGPQSRIFVAVRNSDEPPVAGVAPRMIGAGQHLGAAAIAVDQPRPAMAADVGEGAHLAVVAANDDHAFSEIFEGLPVAGLRNIAFMANHLRRGAQERLLLRLEELGVVIEPAGQAHAVERVGTAAERVSDASPWLDTCHFSDFAAMGAALGAGFARPSLFEDSRRGVPSGYVSDRPKMRE